VYLFSARRRRNPSRFIVDNAYLEDAAREAERLRRWEFMFTLHIYQIQGGTASPFNALATF